MSAIGIEVRWGGGDEAATRRYAAELVALAPDVILASGSVGAEVMLKATRTIPIVFVIVPDPVGSGFVESLSRPGANATGFMMFEYNLCGKWLELLKEIAPSVTHAAVLRDAGTAGGIGQFAVIQSVAPSVGVEVRPIDLRESAQIERVIATFAQKPNGGIILTASAKGGANLNLIIAAAARYKLPAVYIQRGIVAAGGLISYGPNFADQYRRAAEYVDRILKGEKPADLPVQGPNKYELAINLKTAKALGLDVPLQLQQRADEVIE
jgi:putative ABC transport system substrate-binding protein